MGSDANSKVTSKVTLKEGMFFTGELEGFEIPLDADPDFGGKGKGPKPKGLALTSLLGCTSMDVISILRKMRAEPEEFWVEAETELTEEHPKTYKHIYLTFHFKGGKVDQNKAERAVKLSQEQYCGVAAMLKKACPVDYKIVIE